jgi:C_GCAxxG_C_C family probable redox protein
VYGLRFGLDREIALKLAGAFGSGMGMGETCGAVTGAFMIIGLKHGKTKADNDVAKEATYELANEFTLRFKAQNKSIHCRELLGYDLSTPEGRDSVAENNLFVTLCPKFVQDAAEILEALLKE